MKHLDDGPDGLNDAAFDRALATKPADHSARKSVAQARLRAAAEHVEAAQHELERAVSALASLQWMSPEQDKIARLRDRLHEAFYRLSLNSHARSKACAKAELDREVEAGDEEPHKGCCPAASPTVSGVTLVPAGTVVLS